MSEDIENRIRSLVEAAVANSTGVIAEAVTAQLVELEPERVRLPDPPPGWPAWAKSPDWERLAPDITNGGP